MAKFEFANNRKIHNEIISLPISPVLEDNEVEKIVEVVNGYN